MHNYAKYSDQIVDWLTEDGYTHCFFVAGGNIMHLLDSVRERMTCIPVVHEVAAGIAAEYFNETSEASKAFQASKRKNNKQKDDVDLTSSTKQETETNKYETVYTSEKFLEFWDVWPKSKRKQSKPACFKKWKASRTT